MRAARSMNTMAESIGLIVLAEQNKNRLVLEAQENLGH
jgi:hypothetical protein